MKIAIVEDHEYLRNVFIDLISKDNSLELSLILSNGAQFIDCLSATSPDSDPEIAIVDLNMPLKNGFEVANWVQENRPLIRLAVFSMSLTIGSVLYLIKAGVRAIVDKSILEDSLFPALQAIAREEFYLCVASNQLINGLWDAPKGSKEALDLIEKWTSLNQMDKQFIILSCSELHVGGIAQSMNISSATAEEMREKIYKMFRVEGRIGLVKLVMQHRLLDFQ
jgi:DNA-binding NarL/FixJ family response regulator